MNRPGQGPPHNPDRAEEPWFDASIDELAALRARLEGELELTPQVANGIVGALVGQDFDSLATDTAGRYRRILREVGPPNGPRRRTRTTARGSRGHATLELVGRTSEGAVTGMAALAALSGRLDVAAAIVALVPIMYDPVDLAPAEALQELLRAA